MGIFSNKSDHPLASIKSVQQLLSTQSKTDVVVALDEIGQWIDTLFDPENEFRLDHQFAVLRMLDDAAHPYLRRNTNSYFAVIPPAQFQENRLLSSMERYSQACVKGYSHLVRGIDNREKGSSVIKSEIPLISARGIFAVFGRLECAGVRYDKIDQQLWSDLAAMYACAEQGQCQDKQLAIYVSMGLVTSVEHLFASAIMWYGVGEGTLKPKDLHIAKLLMLYMCKAFSVSEQAQADSLFALDIGNPAMPVRVTDDDAMYPDGMRFVNIGPAPGHLDNLLKTLGKGLVPEELNFGVPYSAEVVADVVRRLGSYCKLPLPVRRQQRKKIKVNVNASYGYLNALEQADEGLNIQGSASKICALEDVSLNGIRFVLDTSQLSSINIGTLVGMRPENSKYFGVGIVRRLKRDEKNNLHVGVRILSNKAEVVLLYSEAAGNTATLALLLDYAEAQSGESWILVPADTYLPNINLNMRLGDKNNLLIPVDLVEKGEDFDLVRYRRLEQESDVDVVA